jgi:transporter family-2 protein
MAFSKDPLLNLLRMLVAFTCGGLLALQVVVNSQLRLRVRIDGETLHALQAALANFGGGSVLLIALCFLLRLSWPTASTFGQAPWWVWTGGALGIVYVASSTVIAPRLGVTLFMTLVISGQVAISLAIDHFGFAGSSVKPINIGRVGGAMLVLAGVIVMAVSTTGVASPVPEPPTDVNVSPSSGEM